jgi:hypothetical protein
MSCALDERALAEQLGRFARIGAHAVWTQRHATEYTVLLDADLDDALLHEALAIERACCPFFALIWDESARKLTIAASDDRADVLDHVARAFESAAAAA